MTSLPIAGIRPMTVDEFHAFTGTRPDSEKWELIDGEPILNALPGLAHRRIVRNVTAALFARQRQTAGRGKRCRASAFDPGSNCHPP